MTVSFMRYYTKPLSVLLGLLALFAGLCVNVQAEGLTVNRAEAKLSEEGYQLRAEFNLNLNFAVQQALSHGITLYFVSEFSLTRSRWYWLDEQVSSSEQVTRLYYNVLTRQYRLSHGSLFQSFPSLEEALHALQRQASSYIAAELLAKKGNYLAAARLRLDTNQLPKLLQVNALTGKDWDLDSGWYRWVVSPDDIAARQQNSDEAGR